MISRTVQKLLILIKIIDNVESIKFVTDCLQHITTNQNRLSPATVEKLNRIVDSLPNLRLHFEAGRLFRVDKNQKIYYVVNMTNWYSYDPKAYIKIHNASTLKVGDEVLVTRTCADHEFGWKNSWVNGMTDILNKSKVCEITVDEGSAGFRTKDGNRSYCFPSFVLQKKNSCIRRYCFVY